MVQLLMGASRIFRLFRATIIVTYDVTEMKKSIEEIKSSLEQEASPDEKKEGAIEILDDISGKLDQNKKTMVVKSAFMGLKEMLISIGAEVTATLIMAKVNGL